MSALRRNGALLLAALALPALASAQARDWREIRTKPLRAFEPQLPLRVELPNGLVVFLQEDRELPLVRGTARIRGGSREEPAAKVGLVSVYGQAWRTGGTETQSGDELDDALEARGARVETGGGLDSTFVSFNCLKDNFDEVFAVWLELLRKPAFREDKIALAKNQLNTGIARRNDDPGAIASREARQLGYGEGSPYARVPEYATVAAVTRDDLVAWHAATVHPNNIILGVVGDFDARAMEARLREALAAWPRGASAPRSDPKPDPAKPGVYFVAKDDVTQSQIRMVHAGIRRDHPDYFAVEVMNEILGGGFSSRLVTNVRTKKGLAYSVGGGLGAAFDHPGLFVLSTSTKSGTTAAAIDALHEEIEKLRGEPVTAEELARARDSILNSWVFNFDTKLEVMAERMLYEFYGYPADFLDRYRAGIEAVTIEDVSRVARAHVHHEQLALLVVGKAEEFDRPLSSFGPVETLDVTIPLGAVSGAAASGAAGSGSAGSVPAASGSTASGSTASGSTASGSMASGSAASGSTAEGKALLARVVDGLGGAARLAALRAVQQKASLRVNTPQGEMTLEADSLVVFPDRQRQLLQTPAGEMTTVISPEASFVSGPQGTGDMPASQKENALRELRTSPLALARRAGDEALSVREAGSETIGDTQARVLELSLDGAQVRWLVDPASGRILRTSSQTLGPAGPAEQTMDYTDWRVVNGVAFAFKRQIRVGGEESVAIDLTEVTLDPEVDPKLFERPAEAKP